ncbi:MAG: class I SAM-dependent RNA methyltransferase [Alphaproteobacteria bacterium]|nr:class I SAM-dependent RNA methyltransferase [Alphaproteobacteria bacterium]
MAKTCPLFGICGGCKYDFTAPDYQAKKLIHLRNIPITGDPIWVPNGIRRRADFAFASGVFGLFEQGSKNIVPVQNCPNLMPEINNILPDLAELPWVGAGACLITACDNGIDIAITSNVPYFTPDFRDAAMCLPVIRITWNDRTIKQTAQPIINFSGQSIPYPSGAFLQPSVAGADALRDLVVSRAHGAGRIADLFCGLGNFTFALNADGFDIVGTGVQRDLFKRPLTVGMLNQYDCVVMDPPRAGALAQCQELARSNVSRIIYVSCNPQTFVRDMEILTHGGYKNTELIPVDQFSGSTHWELFGVFTRD